MSSSGTSTQESIQEDKTEIYGTHVYIHRFYSVNISYQI